MSSAALQLRTSRCRPAYQRRIEWVPIREIGVPMAEQVGEDCQQPFCESRAARIAAQFDPDLLGFPLVAALGKNRNGQERLFVLDGQTRIAAVRMALGEDQSIECEVVRGLELREAAALFVGRNTSRRPRAVNVFLVNVTAGEPEAVAITAILAECGVRISRSPGKESETSAVSSLQRIYRLDAREEQQGRLLRRTVQLALAAWGSGADSLTGDILLGLAFVLHRHDVSSFNLPALERKLRGFPGGALGLLGRGRAIHEGLRGSLPPCIARAVVTAYNQGRTKGRLPEWGEK
jgi:hypothetical protein